ncbi:hypothetical protein C8Q76DRAFT_769277 [Earliella scabrosa]|nr:hypothetical protein C8Q76DRAFT_769277 [Earliella scabrosa]
MANFIVTIRILATVLPAAATFLTSLRLYYRWSRRHLGWDDAWAAFAMICEIFLCAGAWTRSDTPQTGPFRHGLRVRVLGYYMLMVSFTCALWAARLSILCSVIRLIPYMMRMRYYAYTAAVLFGCMWAALLILKLYTCETNNTWKLGPGVQCVLGSTVAALELTTDFTADAILILIPIRLLWRIKLPPTRRVLLTGIFSASIFTTITSIVHGYYVLSHNRNAEGIWAHVMASTAVIVANLAVLVPWTMRAFGHHEESEAPRSDRTPNSDGQGPAKDLTTLRFKHHTGPFVLHSLDNKDPGMTTRSVGSCASNESLAPMSFAANKTGKGGAPSDPPAASAV